MKRLLFIITCIIIFIGCKKDESNEKLENLKEKFHGKYDLISSVSEIAVDINMDGNTSKDLILENPELSKCGLEIRILDSDYHLFEEIWAMVSSQVSREEVFDPNKNYSTYGLGYDLYINSSTCLISDDLTSVQLLQEVVENSVNTLRSIEIIAVEEDDIIKVITVRRLYTKIGWITTRIESRYKRYTLIT